MRSQFSWLLCMHWLCLLVYDRTESSCTLAAERKHLLYLQAVVSFPQKLTSWHLVLFQRLGLLPWHKLFLLITRVKFLVPGSILEDAGSLWRKVWANGEEYLRLWTPNRLLSLSLECVSLSVCICAFLFQLVGMGFATYQRGLLFQDWSCSFNSLGNTECCWDLPEWIQHNTARHAPRWAHSKHLLKSMYRRNRNVLSGLPGSD